MSTTDHAPPEAARPPSVPPAPAPPGATAPPTGRETARAASDSAWLVASRLVVAACGWAGSIVTARSLGAEEWGRFSFVFALLGLMAVVTDLGVGRAVLGRLLTHDAAEAGRVGTSFVGLRAVLGLAGYVVALGYVVVTGQPADVVAATAIAALVVLVATPSHALTVLFQSRLRMRRVATGDMLSQVVQLSAVGAVAVTGGHLVWFVVPAVVNELVNIAWRAAGIRRGDLGFHLARRVDTGLWRPMLRESVPLTLGFALVLLLTKVDMLLLERMTSDAEVGRYAIAYKFADVLSLAAITALQPVTTLLVAAWPGDRPAFDRLFRQAVVVVAAVGGLGIVAFVPVARAVVTTLYGDDFASAALPAQLLFVTAVGTALTHLVVQSLIAVDRKELFPVIAAGGLALNVALNLVTIPRWSILGAAGSTLATEVLLAGVFWVVLHRAVGWPVLAGLARPAGIGLVAVVVAAGTALVAGRAPDALWPELSVLAACVYLAVLVTTPVLGRDASGSVRGRLRALVGRA